MFWFYLLKQPGIWLVIGLIAVFAFGGTLEWRRSRRLRSFRARGETSAAWETQFPRSSGEQIGSFLRMFCHAFSLPARNERSFAPSDKVLEIYSALYPLRGMPDSLEIESLALALEQDYHVELESLWNEKITLGDIFEAATKGRTSTLPDS